MKIALLSAASSIHTIRWANGLTLAGHEVHVISQHALSDKIDSKVTMHILPFLGSLGYFLMVPRVRKIIASIKPDIVSAHYASGYGTTARLVNYQPWVLSVWGSDVYDFPFKSEIHKWLVLKNLKAAAAISSTSHCMAEQTKKLHPKLSGIDVVPFGLDLNDFCPTSQDVKKIPKKIVIGTVKTMKHKYGIDTLIHAFALLKKRFEQEESIELELRLVGGGEQLANLKLLTESLEISESVTFTGQVSHSQVPEELSKLDIYIALSRLDSESFGVAILEASAMSIPVVVSDAGGLPEVVLDEITGLVVPRNNPNAAVRALEKLIINPSLRKMMGQNGRKHVSENYSWNSCLEKMTSFYSKFIIEDERKAND